MKRARRMRNGKGRAPWNETRQAGILVIRNESVSCVPSSRHMQSESTSRQRRKEPERAANKSQRETVLNIFKENQCHKGKPRAWSKTKRADLLVVRNESGQTHAIHQTPTKKRARIQTKTFHHRWNPVEYSNPR